MTPNRVKSGSANGVSIGVVAYEMEGTATGVGRYLEGLLSGLVARDVDLTLFMKGEPFAHPLFNAERIHPIFDRRPQARPILWEQLRLPRLLRQHRFDLVFSPSYSLPPRLRAPGIVTIHDLSFEHLPEAFPTRERWRRRYLARRAARRAARVLADTETIADELRSVYALPAAKVDVVPLAVDRRFGPDVQDVGANEDASTIDIDGDAEGPYLLVLGTILDRRRLDAVIAAFDRLTEMAARSDLRLVIAGQNRLPQPERLDGWIASAAARDRIVRLEWVPESALPTLYRQAAAAIYLSTYEGFGLPPLEALACGTPAVVSAGLGLDDLWPDYPLRVDGFAPDAIAGCIAEALGDRGRSIGREGARRMAALSWHDAADRFLDIVHSVVADHGSEDSA